MQDHYRSYRLSPVLSPYIDCVWEEKYFNQPENHSRPQLIVPDNSIELVISDHAVVRRHPESECLLHHFSHLSGLKTRPQEISLQRSCLLSIRFRPFGLYRFTRLPVEEMIDRNLPPEDIFGYSFRQLEAQLFEANSLEQRVTIIEKYFRQKMTRQLDREDRIFEALVNKLEAADGNLSVSALAKIFGLSIKTVERKFNRNLGILPKKYSRLVRLFRALRIQENDRKLSIAETAHYYGFYDQMHFVKEVKHFTGMTPTEFFQRDRGVQEPIFKTVS